MEGMNHINVPPGPKPRGASPLKALPTEPADELLVANQNNLVAPCPVSPAELRASNHLRPAKLLGLPR